MKKILLIFITTLYCYSNTQEIRDLEISVLNKKVTELNLNIECFEMAQNESSLFSCTGSPSITDLSGNEFNRKKSFLLNIKKPLFKLFNEEKMCIENSISSEHIDKCKRESNKIEKRLYIGFENPQDLIRLRQKQNEARNLEINKNKEKRYKSQKIDVKIQLSNSIQRIKVLQYELKREVDRMEILQRKL